MDNPVFKLEGIVHERSAETLQDFEGPLDLILFLLSKNKIEIQDIPIALILDQYLAYLEQRKSLDLEVASEFITMAAHLMYIKTRMLLSLEDEQAQSEMDELIASLKERAQKDTYLRIKLLTKTLGPMGEFGCSITTRSPEPMQRGKVYEYSHEKADLVLAMQAVFDRSEKLAMNFRETNAISALNGISDGEYSYAVIRFEEEYEDFFLSLLRDKDLYYEEIWNFPYVALLAEKDELARSETFSSADLDGYIEIVQGDTTVPYLSSSYLRKNNAVEHSRIFVYDRGSQFDLLDNVPRSYMWVSPFTDSQLHHFRLVQRCCSDDHSRGKDLLVMPKHYKQTDLDKAFLEEVKRVRNSLKELY